jgi:hypothetical protein
MFCTVYYLYRRRRRFGDVVASVERVEEAVLLFVARVFDGVGKEMNEF